MPTLVHNGQVLIETSIIMVYIDEAFEDQMLRTNQALALARCAEWLKRADDIYLPVLGAVTYGICRREDLMQKSPAELDVYYAAIPDAKRRAKRRSLLELGIQSIEVTNGCCLCALGLTTLKLH